MSTHDHDNHGAAEKGSCCSIGSDGDRSACCAPTPSKSRIAVDPVCHMEVDEASAAGGSVRLGGEQYYFCSPFCRAKFVDSVAQRGG